MAQVSILQLLGPLKLLIESFSLLFVSLGSGRSKSAGLGPGAWS